MGQQTVFSAESVTEGNPHKVADQLADSVLDAIIEKDRFARVSCKVLVSTGLVVVAGEVTTDAWVDIGKIVRAKLSVIGYAEPGLGFDANSCAVMNLLQEQSEEIGLAVDRRGAGDQCTVVGYASDEGEGLDGCAQFMPLPVHLAHGLARGLAELRRSGQLKWLRPDGKVGVFVEYDDGRPVHIQAVAVSAQHTELVEVEQVFQALKTSLIEPVLGPTGLLDESSELMINPAGAFTLGGPHGDAGFSGMKVAVDTYGSTARQMEIGLSGKDPTKPGRSGAYMARYVAKNLVAAGLARRCEVRLGYVIGRERPVYVDLETFGTSKVPHDALLSAIDATFDLSIPGIVEEFVLRRPLYTPLACYGHFGRTDLDLPWESTGCADALAAKV
jgi:S-adenosylmethionine synthetase